MYCSPVGTSYHQTTSFLHMQKQRLRSAWQSHRLISAFVFRSHELTATYKPDDSVCKYIMIDSSACKYIINAEWLFLINYDIAK